MGMTGMTYDRIGRATGQFVIPPTRYNENELIRYVKRLEQKVKELETRIQAVEVQKRNRY